MKEKSTPTPTPEGNVAQEGAQGARAGEEEVEARSRDERHKGFHFVKEIDERFNEEIRRLHPLTWEQRVAEEGLKRYGLDPEKILKGLEELRERWSPPPGDRSGEVADRPLGPSELMDHYCGDDVCEHGKRLYENCERCLLPPAPPPAAAPVEETSSGGERCEAATAGGAFFCCEAMQGAIAQRFAEMDVAQWRISFLLVRLKTSKAGYPVKEFYRQPLRRCPWCGSPPLERDDVPLAPEQYEEARELLAPADLTLDETGCIQPLVETSSPRSRS